MADEQGGCGQPGFDPSLANQLTLQALTGALNQQQLNAIQARSMVANVCNVLTLGVQLNHTAALQQLTGLSPLAAAAAADLAQANDVQRIAALQAVHAVPRNFS